MKVLIRNKIMKREFQQFVTQIREGTRWQTFMCATLGYYTLLVASDNVWFILRTKKALKLSIIPLEPFLIYSQLALDWESYQYSSESFLSSSNWAFQNKLEAEQISFHYRSLHTAYQLICSTAEISNSSDVGCRFFYLA